MIVFYLYCKASDEGDLAGFVTTWDREVTWLDYETINGPSECIWFVPGTEPKED